MDLGDFETTVKVIVVGNGGVGKSSMTARYCKGVFTDTYKKTIGVDFLEKSIVVDEAGGETVKMMIWDTAGQEEFDALTAAYYRGAGACAIVFSSTDRASFEAVDKWKRKVEDEVGPGIPTVLVQNKIDLIDQAAMTQGEAEAAARRLGVRMYRTCVKDNVNVSEVFEYLAAQFILRGGDTSGVSALPAAGDFRPGAAPPAPSSQAGGSGIQGGSGLVSSGGAGSEGSRHDSAGSASSDSKIDAGSGQRSAGSNAAANGSGAGSGAHAPAPAAAPVPAPAPAPAAAAASDGKIKLGQEPAGKAGAAKKKSGGFAAFC